MSQMKLKLKSKPQSVRADPGWPGPTWAQLTQQSLRFTWWNRTPAGSWWRQSLSLTGRSAPPLPPTGSTNPGPPLAEDPPTSTHARTHRGTIITLQTMYLINKPINDLITPQWSRSIHFLLPLSFPSCSAAVLSSMFVVFLQDHGGDCSSQSESSVVLTWCCCIQVSSPLKVKLAQSAA